MGKQDNMSNEAMQARLNELQQMEANGELDDMGRQELANMRDNMSMEPLVSIPPIAIKTAPTTGAGLI